MPTWRGYNVTRSVERVMALANQEAQRINVPAIHAAHLLIALARSHEGVGPRLLLESGFDVSLARSEIQRRIPASDDMVTMPIVPPTAAVLRVFDSAATRATHAGRQITTPDVLWALLNCDDATVQVILSAPQMRPVSHEELRSLSAHVYEA